MSEWETPEFEEVSVSAEVTAYFGVLAFEDGDDDE
jgi:coenzyme PQQ precursor peptide PqqA